jgi:hypothetical protein
MVINKLHCVFVILLECCHWSSLSTIVRLHYDYQTCSLWLIKLQTVTWVEYSIGSTPYAWCNAINQCSVATTTPTLSYAYVDKDVNLVIPKDTVRSLFVLFSFFLLVSVVLRDLRLLITSLLFSTISYRKFNLIHLFHELKFY